MALYASAMADPDSKPPAEDDGDDLEMYELAEDPNEPAAPPPPPPGVSTGDTGAASKAAGRQDGFAPDPRFSSGGSRTDAPALDDPSDDAVPDEPEYVNPEIARQRREDARRAGAEEWAREEAAKKKRLAIIAAVVLVVLILAWIVLF